MSDRAQGGLGATPVSVGPPVSLPKMGAEKVLVRGCVGGSGYAPLGGHRWAAGRGKPILKLLPIVGQMGN